MISLIKDSLCSSYWALHLGGVGTLYPFSRIPQVIRLTNPPLALQLVPLEHTSGVQAPQENRQFAHCHPTRLQEPAAHQSKAVGNVEPRNSAGKIVMSVLWSNNGRGPITLVPAHVHPV